MIRAVYVVCGLALGVMLQPTPWLLTVLVLVVLAGILSWHQQVQR